MLPHNLRPDPDDPAGKVLAPVLPPETVMCPDGWKPLAGVRIGDDDVLLMKNGSAIGFLRGIAVPMPLQLPSAPIAVVAVRPGLLLVTTEVGVFAVDVDRATFRLTLLPDIAGLFPSLRAVPAGQVSVVPRAVKVDADAAAGTLGEAAVRRFVSSARDAVGDLEAAAIAEGVCIHPAVGVVRAFDADGRLLFASSPVLLCRADGGELSGSFAFSAAASSPGYAVSAEITAPAWRPQLSIPDALLEALPAGAVVEVLLSPGFAAFDAAAVPTVSPRRRSSDPLAVVSFRRSVLSASSLLTAPLARVWASRAPLASQVIVASLPAASTARDGSAADVADYAPVFTARGAAVGASTVVWAAPTAGRPVPPGAECFAVDAAADRTWHAYVAVEFADGSSQVALSEGSSGAPALFSPLLCYPAPDAVAIEVAVSSAGTVRRGRFPLTPFGSRAVYLHPSRRPFELPESAPAFVPPVAAPRFPQYPSSVAVASLDAPLAPFAMLSPGSGAAIHAVVPAIASQSPWDFGRSRFYVFASDGIYLLIADPSRRTASLSRIDSRVVQSSYAVCHVDGALAAIASGDIVTIAGNRVQRIARVPTATALAWAHADHELWCITPAGVEVVCFDRRYSRYLIPDVYPAAPVQASLSLTYL